MNFFGICRSSQIHWHAAADPDKCYVSLVTDHAFHWDADIVGCFFTSGGIK
jgi:hypothetical protein